VLAGVLTRGRNVQVDVKLVERDGEVWWHWQLVHPRFGMCGNGWERTQEAAERAGHRAAVGKEVKLT
jgi:hypothetical protein